MTAPAQPPAGLGSSPPSSADAGDAQRRSFLRVLAHELRNNVAPIQNAMHLLRLRARTDASLLPIAEIIERQVTGMLRTLEAIGEADRASRGEIELDRAPMGVATLVARAAENVRPLAETRGSHLDVADLGALPMLEVDVARLTRAFASLLDNAVRYSPPGSHIGVHAQVLPDTVEIAIDDEGPGLGPERALDFFVGPQEPGHGLGIGLPLARVLIELHGGTLRIVPRATRGTRVTVRLPLAAAEYASREGVSGAGRHDTRHTPAGDSDGDGEGRAAAGATGPRTAGQGSHVAAGVAAQPGTSDVAGRPAPGGWRVLIADDSAAVRISLTDLLEEMGHTVHAAADGVEAVRMAQAWRPEFVLLDVHMPRLNGMEAARQIRAMYPPSVMQLVLLSGDDLDETMRRGAQQAGFDHCVDKGLAIGELTRLLARSNAL